MNPDRPDPDALLASLKDTDSVRRRGRLTIFLGMCAGVGKTYTMLRMAQQRRAEGIDLVVAIVETHGRSETAALLSGLPSVPRRRIEYRGTGLEEMDLDAVVQRRPQLAVVDEFAHTNAPGSRHPKRYQDVLELLEAGVDVYTTLNVQHIESRVDVVRQITGITVRETVPDSVLDEADEVQLVDLAPERLRERLADGQVYLGAMAQTAAAHFFREENLTALRELALRLTAERVNRDLRDAMATRQIAGPWKTNVKLLVAVGASPYSEALIRWTRRAATTQGVPWVAVHVDLGRQLGEEERARLARSLALARQLGAQVVMTNGEDLVDAILRVAHAENVTQIVVGKTMRHPLGSLIRGGAFIDRLLRRSGDIDICAVRVGSSPPGPAVRAAPDLGPWTREIGEGSLAVAAVTGACWMVRDWTGYWAVALIYLSLVVFLAIRLRRGTIMAVAAASALLWDYLFIPPSFSLRISHFHDALMLVMYFIVASVIGQLTARLRFRELAERRREERTAALYRMAQGVVESTTLDEGIRRAMAEVRAALAAQTALLLSDEGQPLAAAPHPASDWHLTEKERSVAVWAFLHGQPSGRFTDTLPEAECLHLPLHTTKNKVGVLAVHFGQRRTLAADERELLDTLADQMAVMIERYALIGEAGRTQLAEESEKLYRMLFDCVSHEIKTPLSVIQAATAELGLVFDLVAETRAARPFLKEIETASRRLGRIVDNLLSMTRIESGRYKLEPVWCDVDDLVGAARHQVEDLLARHEIRVVLPADLPSVNVDAAFMEQSLANLLANAAQYSPPGSEIRVWAQADGPLLVIGVTDSGPGLPPGASQRVFEKFYRAPGAPPGGIGLGLSIVRGLMHALGGEVTAENNTGPGATFTLRIPAEIGRIPESP